MKRLKILLSLFNVRPGEERSTVLMFGHAFAMGMSTSFFETAATALFLVRFDEKILPYIYIAAAVVNTLTGIVYSRIGDRTSFANLMRLTLIFLFVVVCALWLGISLTEVSWLLFGLLIWYRVLSSLTDLEYWAVAMRLYDVRQGKRLFSFIGSGEVVARIASSFSAPLLIGLVGVTNLLLLSAIGLALSLLFLTVILRLFSDKLSSQQTPDKRDEGESKKGGWKQMAFLLQNRYLALMAFTTISAILAKYFVDFGFLAEVQARNDDVTNLARFFAIFSGVTQVINLVIRMFLSGRFLNRYGIKAGLIIQPILHAVCTLFIILAGTVFGARGIVFWLIVANQGLYKTLKHPIDNPSFKILYQPLHKDQRLALQIVIEAIIIPMALGVAGVIILLFSTVISYNPTHFAYVMFVTFAAWIVTAAYLAYKEYPIALMHALKKRILDSSLFTVNEPSSILILQQGLQSPHPGVVIYSLNMLEAVEHESLVMFLQDLLAHPVPEVRRDVLERIERQGLTSLLPSVSKRVTQEPLPEVRGTALRVLAALGETAVFEEVSAYLENPDPQIRMGAMVGLLRSGGIEGVLAAGHELVRIVNAQESAERALAARVLGEVGVRSFYQSLSFLLKDGDVQVQRAALLAAGQVKNAKLWPLVLEKIDAPRLRRVAALALVAGGQEVLPQIGATYDREGQSPQVQAQLVQICGRIGGERAIDWLKGQLDHPDAGVRTQVLHALHRCGYRARDKDAVKVQAQIATEAALAAETLAILVDIADTQHPADKQHPADTQHPGDDGALELLCDALDETLAQDRWRIFFLLSFLYDRQSIIQARDTLCASLVSADKRTYALEVIDVLVGQELKKMFFPLLIDATPGQKLGQLQAIFPQPQRDRPQRLRELVSSPPGRFNAWAKSCALYAAGYLSATALGETMLAALSVPQALVRETAIWALAALDVGDAGVELDDRAQIRSQIQVLYDDPYPQVARVARRWETLVAKAESRAPWHRLPGQVSAKSGTNRAQEEIMLSTIEKVLIMKRGGIFAEIPNETLVKMAALLEEMPLSAGKTLFEKGDRGDCMYIIISGEVRVHDGERTLNHLYEGDIFGEMAVLDAEPRVASITSVVDTQLLRLNQEPFYELMDDRSEVSRGIILVLIRHLRARVKDLDALRARFEAEKVSH